MVKDFNFIWAIMLGILWALTFKLWDTSMSLFQVATLGLLTAILFLLEGKK